MIPLFALLTRLARVLHPIGILASHIILWYTKRRDAKIQEQLSGAVHSGNQNEIEVALESDFANIPSGDDAAELREPNEVTPGPNAGIGTGNTSKTPGDTKN